MILYALACPAGHRFDSWFRDSHTFETQAAIGLVVCPVCASAEVTKAIMAPAIVGARRVAPAADEAPQPETMEQTEAPRRPEPAAKPEAAQNVALLGEGSRELRDLARQLREKLVAGGHDVGTGFAREARRIHEGDAPNRQIYGQASVAEARDLIEDGIMVLPLPNVPDDLN